MRGNALVVDDRDLNRLTISSFLSASGFETDTAESGLAGLECLRKKKYDLIFSDIEMPNMNGFEFLQEIKEDPNLKDIPVVILSSLVDEHIEKRVKKLGAVCYITKPFNRAKMLAALDLAGFRK